MAAATSYNLKKKNQLAQSTQTQNVKVVVRIRPLSQQEGSQNVKSVINCHTHKEMFLKERRYTFDRVFKPTASQIELYRDVVAPLLKDVIDGYNCTVFAYGQTGTGKTYTMTGQKCNLIGNWKTDEDAGIIPRAAFHVFDMINKSPQEEVDIKVSYIELYNEEIRDLLSDDENVLQIYSDTKGNVSIQGASEVHARDGEEICKLLQRGILKRQMASTLMNHQSSRSHTVFTITITSNELTSSGDDLLKTGKINLVDLAGSENIARSGCKEMRATELANINKSLLTLGRVIHALADKSQRHIPYRDSKLTRILQDSLGGNTKTVIIATVSPAHNSHEVTASTLDYATRARDIRYTLTKNEKLSKNEFVEDLVKEIDRLQKDLDSARQGTGFYVDKENFRKMIDAIVAFTGEPITAEQVIEQKAERIKTLEDLLKDRVNEFDYTVDQCKKHKTELEMAKSAIKERDEILQQERFLSRWYENQTAEKLEEAQKLLSVTKTLHSEKELLLAKLENQFSINAENETITKKAVTDVTNILDKFSKEELDKVKESEAVLKADINDNMLGLQKDVAKSLNSLREFSQQCKAETVNGKNGFSARKFIQTKTNEYLDIIRKKTNTFEIVLSEYEKQLQELRSCVPKIANHHKRNTEMFLEKSATLVHSSIKKCEAEVVEQYSKYNEHLDHLEKKLVTRNQEREQIIALLQKQTTEDNMALNNIQKERENLITVQKRAENYHLETRHNFDKLTKESTEALENCPQLPDLIEIQSNDIQELLMLVKDFESQLNKIASFIDKKEEKMMEHMLEEFDRMSNACKDIENSLNEKVNSLIEHLDLIVGKTVKAESFTTFVKNIKQVLNEQILQNNIKLTHVGDTPIRQSTSYPARLKDVAPREALLEQFKQSVKSKFQEGLEVLSDEDL